MTQMTIEFIVGGPARNQDFLYREEFVDDLCDSLRRNNVLLSAARRMGKTSVMYRLLDQPCYGYQAIHLNVEHLSEPGEFFIYLLDAMQSHQPALLRRLAQGVSFLSKLANRIESLSFGYLKLALRESGAWTEDWRSMAGEFFDRVQASEEKILFIIDEFPDLILAMERASPDDLEPFLHLLRDYRTQRDSQVRWLLGGSVNIRGTLERRGLIKVINDLKVEILPPFTGDQVSTFVTTALKERSIQIDENLVPRIQELLGEPIPFFLQLFTHELYRFWRRHRPDVLAATHADLVFEEALLGEMARDKLQHFRSRIFQYYPKSRQDICCRLLDQLSATPKGLLRRTLFSRFRQLAAEGGEDYSESIAKQEFDGLLALLQSDFYVEEAKNGRMDFVNQIIKAWWRKNYGRR